jgi:hypothetical protein
VFLMQEPVFAGMESERFVGKLSIRANGTRRKHDTSVEIADCVQTLVGKANAIFGSFNIELFAAGEPLSEWHLVGHDDVRAYIVYLPTQIGPASSSFGLSATAPSKIASFIASLRMLDAVGPIARAVRNLVSARSQLSSKGADRFTLPL